MKLIKLGLAALLLSATAAHAGIVTVGPGGFDDGWATEITYDDAASRGSSNDRDNPLNALGSSDGKFFEIGTGSTVDLTFGSLFDTSVSVFEITFGNPSNFPEQADLFVGNGSTFTFIQTFTNSQAQGGLNIDITSFAGVFDTVRLVDGSSQNPGGLDIDAVRVTPVPAPATALLFCLALLGASLLSRRQN